MEDRIDQIAERLIALELAFTLETIADVQADTPEAAHAKLAKRVSLWRQAAATAGEPSGNPGVQSALDRLATMLESFSNTLVENNEASKKG